MNPFSIRFFSEQTSFYPKNKKQIKGWINEVIQNEGYTGNELNIIFCNDEYLLSINKKFLNHDSYTDIITFDYTTKQTKPNRHSFSTKKSTISGELFISIDRVKENTKKHNTTLAQELHRVIVHGVLHLCDYSDKSPASKRQMTNKEDYYLSLINFVSSGIPVKS